MYTEETSNGSENFPFNETGVQIHTGLSTIVGGETV